MIRHIIKLIWAKRKANALMILELFLAFLVLFAAFSFIYFQMKKVKNPMGFEVENCWMITVEDLQSKDSSSAAIVLDQLKNTLKGHPQVSEVGFSNSIGPYLNNTSTTSNDEMGFTVVSRILDVDLNFSAAMKLEVTQGRWFNEDDLHGKYNPVVVNEYFAETYFPGKSIVDSIIRINGDRKVVGIIKDYRYQGKFDPLFGTTLMLMPHTDKNMSNIYLKMKDGTPLSIQREINDIVKKIVGSNGFIIKTLSQEEARSDRSYWIPIIALLSICIFLCLNISMGLFGVLWYNINKRRPEIGLRRALGAHSSDIAYQFLAETMGLVLCAILLGILFAIQVPLLHIIPIDDSIFYAAILSVSILLIVLVLICAFIPSRQAAAIQPSVALHED